MDFVKSFFVAASGMKAQSERIRVVSQNIANSNSTAATPGGDPYRRKTISFASELDRSLGIDLVKVTKVGVDGAPFGTKFQPHHPAANDDGYVKMPNVNGLIEMADMREAQRSYEANLSVVEIAKALASRTLEILRV